MKKTLLFFCVFFLLFVLTIGRYRPVSLDLIQPTTMHVEIKGAVKNPGFYEVKWKVNVKEIIQVAGGKSENADTSSLSLVRE